MKRRDYSWFHGHKKWIVRNYYEQLYAKKFENLGKLDKFLRKYNLSKLNQEEAESLNWPIITSEIEEIIIIKKKTALKSSGLDGFMGEFYETLKEELTPTLLRICLLYTSDAADDWLVV